MNDPTPRRDPITPPRRSVGSFPNLVIGVAMEPCESCSDPFTDDRLFPVVGEGRICESCLTRLIEGAAA